MMSLHLVVGFLLLKSCLMAFAKTSARPLPFFWVGVLLGADDDGFGAIALVDAVDYFVKSFHLTNLFGGDIEEVLLDGAVGTDTHHDDTSPLILHTLNENTIQHLCSCLHNGNR